MLACIAVAAEKTAPPKSKVVLPPDDIGFTLKAAPRLKKALVSLCDPRKRAAISASVPWDLAIQ
jgi:hypothetical protein